LFKSVGSTVNACDISENMLTVARKAYKEIQYKKVEFQICDAEKVRETLEDHFDLAISLRLLHRVPEKVKMNILEELSSIADYSIVSFGVKSSYHNLRKTVRHMLFGGRTTDLCYEPLEAIVEKIEKNFEIIDYKWVLPWISQEIIFFLRPRGN